MYDIANFKLSDTLRCGADLRGVGDGAGSLEDACRAAIDYLYARLGDGSSPACVLARAFLTLPYGSLPPGLQQFARRFPVEDSLTEATRCLTLLATTGSLPEWNSRLSSEGHQAIPLASEQAIAGSPMIASLLAQLGVPTAALLGTSPELMVDLATQNYNVFHVPVALGSPLVPAQREFVIPHRVESVLGFGGMLGPGTLFAVILFLRVRVSHQTAELFRTVALNMKVALLPLQGGAIFS
ncbi:MAG: hypothetical protein HY816_10190 [Candidatus Wallbacteria bacterium]|nr:hypothetical protein [Candidatus Wallbacteria bacterium]